MSAVNIAQRYAARCDHCNGAVVADDCRWVCLACGCVWNLDGKRIVRGGGCGDDLNEALEKMFRRMGLMEGGA